MLHPLRNPTTRVFHHWASYAQEHQLPLLPIDPINLGNCLSIIADNSVSFATISTLVAAVARQHWDHFMPSPTENFAFRRLLQGFRRRLSKPPKPKPLLKLCLRLLLSLAQVAAFKNGEL